MDNKLICKPTDIELCETRRCGDSDPVNIYKSKVYIISNENIKSTELLSLISVNSVNDLLNTNRCYGEYGNNIGIGSNNFYLARYQTIDLLNIAIKIKSISMDTAPNSTIICNIKFEFTDKQYENKYEDLKLFPRIEYDFKREKFIFITVDIWKKTKPKKIAKISKDKYHKFNYTNNVNCVDIKPIERRLFKYLCRQIDYGDINYNKQKFIRNFPDIIHDFQIKYNVPDKLITYYLDKWERLGFFEHKNEKLDSYFSWFRFIDVLAGKRFDKRYSNKWERYTGIFPKRVKRKSNLI